MTEKEPGGGNTPSPAEAIEFYYARGVTDGLPVVPPARPAVEAMLTAGGVAADTVVAAMPSHQTEVSGEKVAINAVMAGCLPEYMPVVVAAVRAFCEPAFNGSAPACTTGSTSMVLIVNGPIAKSLGINARDNVFGHGFRANATIGRALRLILLNVFNFRPGETDRSTQGDPGRYSFCFAENEEVSPWEPLHVERGFSPQDSTVTLFPALGKTAIRTPESENPEPTLLMMADAMSYLGSHNIRGGGEVLTVWAQEVTDRFARAGWDKSRIRAFLWEHAQRSLADLKRVEHFPGAVEPGDEARWQKVVARPEDILLVAAGARWGNHAACLPGWGLYENASRSVTVPVIVP